MILPDRTIGIGLIAVVLFALVLCRWGWC